MRSSRVGGSRRDPKGKNWMTAMGILFIVMALIIALRNLYFITTELSFAFYLDNYTNGQITNEKFLYSGVISRRTKMMKRIPAMKMDGGVLIMIRGNS